MSVDGAVARHSHLSDFGGFLDITSVRDKSIV